MPQWTSEAEAQQTGRVSLCRVSEFFCCGVQGTQSSVAPPAADPLEGGVSLLDILPLSAAKAEIFIQEAQLPTYRAALQMYVLTDPSPFTERD